MFLELFTEKVNSDCSQGSGVIPTIGPYKDFVVVRTSHLDDPRNPPDETQRDAGFDCDSFDDITTAFFRKRPLGVADGDYSIFWKNAGGVQTAIININNKTKKLTYITIMQLNKRNMNDYRIKKKTIKLDLGRVNEPDQTNERFMPWSTAGIKKQFIKAIDYIEKTWNIERVQEVKDTLKVKLETSMSSSELSELEDLFPNLLFTINRQKQVLVVE